MMFPHYSKTNLPVKQTLVSFVMRMINIGATGWQTGIPRIVALRKADERINYGDVHVNRSSRLLIRHLLFKELSWYGYRLSGSD